MGRFIFILPLALALLISSVARAETITIVADNWCPYNCDPADEHPGFMIEIAKKAFEKHGIDIGYSLKPWTRAIEDARAGQHTAIVGAAHSDAPDFVFPSTPQGMMIDGFYTKQDSPWRYEGPESLEKISIGAITGYSYDDLLDAYIQKNKSDLRRVQLVSGDNPLEINIKKLMLGRIGALVEDVNVMSLRLKGSAEENLIHLVGQMPPSPSQSLFVAFSPAKPKAKTYAEILSKETESMRQSGELDAILSHYGLKSADSLPATPPTPAINPTANESKSP